MNLFSSGIDFHMSGGGDEIPTNLHPINGFGAPGFNNNLIANPFGGIASGMIPTSSNGGKMENVTP